MLENDFEQHCGTAPNLLLDIGTDAYEIMNSLERRKKLPGTGRDTPLVLFILLILCLSFTLGEYVPAANGLVVLCLVYVTLADTAKTASCEVPPGQMSLSLRQRIREFKAG